MNRPEAVKGEVPPPLVSVVIPSYNHAAYVESAIRSVVSQTWRPIELVVVDDGSTDDSVARIRSLRAALQAEGVLAGLSGFTLCEQENRGAHRAIARAVEASRGELVAVLNSDDLFHPRRLELMVPALAAGAELAFSEIGFVGPAGETLDAGHHWPVWYAAGVALAEALPTTGFALLLRNFSVSSSNFVFRRSLYDRLGGFAALRFTHDWDFLLRALYFSEPVWVRSLLLSYRSHDSNTTEKVRHLLTEECEETLRRYARLFAAGPSPNPLAPWPTNWPGVFPAIAAAHAPAFTERSLREVLERLDGAPA